MIVAPWKHQLTWKRWWKIRHTGVVVGSPVIGNRFLVQAEPGGVEMIQMHPDLHWTDEWIYIRPHYQPGQADRVAEIAIRQARKKIPYSFECYPAILAHRTHFPIPHVDDWLARTDADGDPARVICSWEVDSALTLAGFKVFNDGRVPHDVVPSELYLRLLELGPAEVFSRSGLNWIPREPGRRHAVRPSGNVAPIPGYLL